MEAVVKSLRTRNDFASKNKGATILKSDKAITNANSILAKSNDEYLLVPECNDEYKELIIHLSEEVSVEHILADNHEDFSASFSEIKFYGSSEYPPKYNKWQNIGVIYPDSDMNYYIAEIDPSYA